MDASDKKRIRKMVDGLNAVFSEPIQRSRKINPAKAEFQNRIKLAEKYARENGCTVAEAYKELFRKDSPR